MVDIGSLVGIYSQVVGYIHQHKDFIILNASVGALGVGAIKLRYDCEKRWAREEKERAIDNLNKLDISGILGTPVSEIPNIAAKAPVVDYIVSGGGRGHIPENYAPVKEKIEQYAQKTREHGRSVLSEALRDEGIRGLFLQKNN